MADWMEWHGGARPVAADKLVAIRHRYAGGDVRLAGEVRWSHDLYNAYGAEDIVAFRLFAADRDDQPAASRA